MVLVLFAGRVSRLFLDFSADDVILCALFWNARPPKASFGGESSPKITKILNFM